MGPDQTQKLLHSKGNHKLNEKTTHRTGENIVNDATNKGLISKMYRQLIQLMSLHGQRSPAGYRPWGRKELNKAEQLSTYSSILQKKKKTTKPKNGQQI